MTMGPREMRALREGAHPDSSIVAWARFGDAWSLVHHNLFRATKDATRSMRRLGESLRRHDDEVDS